VAVLEGTSLASDVEQARALIVALSQDRLDDVLALADQDIVWLPTTRPGRSRYTGHAGTAELIRDVHQTLGPFRVAFDEHEILPDGRIRLRGWRIRSEDRTDPLDVLVTVRGGLVTRVDSRDVGET